MVARRSQRKSRPQPATCAPAAAASACTCATARSATSTAIPTHPLNKGVICAKGASRHHEAVVAGAADAAAAAQGGRRARRRRVRADLAGTRRSRCSNERLAKIRADRSEEVRALHRPRPDAGADRAVRAPVRHAELRGARRLLLGQHGRRHDLHDRRLVLGVRRPGPRPREAVRDDRHRRGPPLQPAQDRDLEVQARGGRFISINPVRTGYSAIADEWMPIRPGTDGALLLALMPRADAPPASTTASSSRATPTPGYLVNVDAAQRERGPVRAATRPRPKTNPFQPPRTSCGGTGDQQPRRCRTTREGADPALDGEYRAAPTARRSSRRSSCCASACAECTPEWAAEITGIAAETIRRARARDGRHGARPEDSSCRSPWTDSWGAQARRRVTRQSGRVPRDARPRGAFERLPDDPRAVDPDVAARAPSTGRADSATRRRSRAARRRSTRASQQPGRGAARYAARGRALGLPAAPDDLFVDDDGKPVRIDKALLVGVPARGARA